MLIKTAMTVEKSIVIAVLSYDRVIGQKVLIKTAVAIEISMVMAVLSCF